MKRLVYSLTILSVLMFACSISTTATPPVVTQPPAAATETPEAMTDTPQPSATATETPPQMTNTPSGPQANVICNGLSLYLDPALGSGFNCETVPEVSEGIAIAPQYTNLTLQGYVFSDRSFGPFISVFPVQSYDKLWPGFITGAVTPLQNLIDGAAPAASAPFGQGLPFLPNVEAGQIFNAQYQVLPFASGSGIRYLTLLAQNYAVINNHDLIYTYQGLTSDGQYWVSVVLPITNSILPENGDTYPGGQTWDQFTQNYDPYIADITNQLNAQTPGSFLPTLSALDALISSMKVQP